MKNCWGPGTAHGSQSRLIRNYEDHPCTWAEGEAPNLFSPKASWKPFIQVVRDVRAYLCVRARPLLTPPCVPRRDLLLFF